jgi:hypothetical protein
MELLEALIIGTNALLVANITAFLAERGDRHSQRASCDRRGMKIARPHAFAPRTVRGDV